MTLDDNHVRVFIGFGIPEDIRHHLSQFQTIPNAQPVAPQNLHITLRYLDLVTKDQLEDIQVAVSQIRKNPFPIVVKGVGCFERKEGAVVYASIENHRPIHDLTARISDKLAPLGFSFSPRPMVPHITLYKNVQDFKAIEKYSSAHKNTLRTTWLAERFHLFQSVQDAAGNHYQILDTYPLF